MKTFQFHRARHGFTLVEISIVLVIIGLLVGGVLGGKAMIRASEMQTVTADVNKYMLAIKSFKTQYGALPGDMTNATNYWGVAGGTGSDATCRAVNSTGLQATCNGDGNGQLLSTEFPRVWQHLANAGFVEGTYSGLSPCTAGVSCPLSKIQKATYLFHYSSIMTATTPIAIDGNVILFGGNNSAWGPTASIVDATEAYAIDTKFDDGLPQTGNTIGPNNAMNPGCASASAYTLTSVGTPVCILSFIFSG